MSNPIPTRYALPLCRLRHTAPKRSPARKFIVGLLGAAFALAGATQVFADDTSKDNWKAGSSVYFHCTACHSLAHNSRGPRHCGLFGRRAGSAKGYIYSDAMEHSKIVWNETTLDRFLENPQAAVPGTAMGYEGVKDPQERADLIAFLRKASTSAACRR